ncbi:MAG: site-2 protease family protein [Clostridia bacterium]|nr:site-2 protease family protein [Clostridia bacterium]
MLFSLFTGDARTTAISILLTLPTILIALSAHEAAHGYIAYKLGDRTAFNLGRITLNPFKHLDPIGALFMLVFGYGWAKPVPINARNFKDPRKGMALTALAGPATNLILGTIGVMLYYLVLCIAYSEPVFNLWFSNYTLEIAISMILIFLRNFAFLNFLYTVFNLIPVPPFDGSRIFSVVLPTKVYFKIMKYERYYLIAILGISIVCSRLFNFSPFVWLADKLFNLIAYPFAMLFSLIF